MREVLTIQLGQRSNYLATHFWNTQESYFTYSSTEDPIVDHDVHFRPGVGAHGEETYTPRTVIYDLKGGFGSLRQINALYAMEEEATPQGLWDGKMTIQKLPVIEQSDYQQALDQATKPATLTTSSVRYWSDFSRVFYHPRSIVQLNEYDLNSKLLPFENWDTGEELFRDLDKEHDLLDRDLRLFAEECDQMQAIQVMTGVDDAWGGFAARYLDRLRDEYGKTSIWIWGSELGDRVDKSKQLQRTINVARSTSAMAGQASLYIPVTDPPPKLPSYINLDRKSEWHTAGLLSTALETITLPSRLKINQAGSTTLHDMAALLNVNGNQNIAQLHMAVRDPELGPDGLKPVSLGSKDSRMAGNENEGKSENFDSQKPNLKDNAAVLDVDLSATADLGTFSLARRQPKKEHVFGRVETVRGSSQPQSNEDEDEERKRVTQRFSRGPVLKRYHSTLGYPLVDSFPDIYWKESPNRPHDSLVVHSTLTTTSAVADRLRAMNEVVGRSAGLSERENLYNDLSGIREAYEEGWESGSDSDDDDN